MGCKVCRNVNVRQNPPPGGEVKEDEGDLPANQGSLTTVAPSAGSPQSAVKNESPPSQTHSGSLSQFPERRAAGPLSLSQAGAKQQKSQGDDSKEKSGKQNAPSYLVNKSIANARVRVGDGFDIREKYDLGGETLGTGVSGAVRIAIEKSTGKKFAVKTLNLEHISSKKSAMLHNEVEIYLKLDHPNIAKLVEVYEDEKKIYLIMELCTGKELYDRLAARKRYCESDAARVTRQMLEAINYCHKHSICHRDLKLENWVYATEADDAPLKLIDFGFSRIFNPVVPMTAMHGTVYYVSPEVMDGCYREKCDIWSIGVIVYMLLSGTPPFNGSVDYKVLVKIRAAQYSFDGPVWKVISEDAKDFIRYLLVRDPAQRPSAEEALQHRWLKETAGDEDDREINVEVLQAMREFAVANVMKRAAIALVAYSLTNDQVQDLYKDFKKLDKNKTGAITMHELADALTEHLGVSSTEASEIFENIGHTGDREVHYTEFLAASLHAKMILDQSWVQEAFNRMDLDHDGLITLEDMSRVLGDTFNNVPIEDILDSCCPPGKQGLDFASFTRVLTSPEDVAGKHLGENPDKKTLHTRASLSDAVLTLQLTNDDLGKLEIPAASGLIK